MSDLAKELLALATRWDQIAERCHAHAGTMPVTQAEIENDAMGDIYKECAGEIRALIQPKGM